MNISPELAAAIAGLIATLGYAWRKYSDYRVMRQERDNAITENERLRIQADSKDDDQRNKIIGELATALNQNNEVWRQTTQALQGIKESLDTRDTAFEEMINQLKALRTDVKAWPEQTSSALTIMSDDVKNLSAAIRKLNDRLDGVEKLPASNQAIQSEITALARKCSTLIDLIEAKKILEDEKKSAA